MIWLRAHGLSRSSGTAQFCAVYFIAFVNGAYSWISSDNCRLSSVKHAAGTVTSVRSLDDARKLIVREL